MRRATDLGRGAPRINSMRRLVLLTLLIASAASFAAFTDQPARPSSRVRVSGGITIRLAPEWQFLRGQLSETVSPIPRLAIASFRARLSKRECECGFPNVVSFPRDGAFVFVWEYPNYPASRFPRRPAHFELTDPAAQRFECQGPSTSFDFRVGDRGFEADVYLGRDVTHRVRAQLLAALDSFRATPQ